MDVKSSLDDGNARVNIWRQRHCFSNPAVQNMLLVPSAADQWVLAFQAVEEKTADFIVEEQQTRWAESAVPFMMCGAE